MKIYAGIGSRETPTAILDTMFTIGHYLAGKGWTLRSGKAPKADTAFENGAKSRGGRLDLYTANQRLEPWWIEFAEMYHPAWDALTDFGKKLQARNTPIILGPKSPAHSGFEPSDLVICWTLGGREMGGTGQGIRIANAYGIPIFNLGRAGAKDELKAWLRAHP